MDAVFFTILNKILCAGYVFSMVCMNCILYLFSSFYRKKFGQSSPRAGFIIAALLALGYIFFQMVTVEPHSTVWMYVRVLRTVCLAGSAIASIWGCTYLFYTMKRTRK